MDDHVSEKGTFGIDLGSHGDRALGLRFFLRSRREDRRSGDQHEKTRKHNARAQLVFHMNTPCVVAF